MCFMGLPLRIWLIRLLLGVPLFPHPKPLPPTKVGTYLAPVVSVLIVDEMVSGTAPLPTLQAQAHQAQATHQCQHPFQPAALHLGVVPSPSPAPVYPLHHPPQPVPGPTPPQPPTVQPVPPPPSS